MAEEHVLRLGIDPGPAEAAARRYEQATGKAAESAVRLADTVEEQAKRERRFRESIEQAEREYQNNRQQRAQQAAATAAEQARAQAQAQVQALESTFREEMARIREAQMRGFLTPAEAAQAGRESAMAYNQGVLQVIDQGQRNRGLIGAGGRDVYAELAGSLKDVGTAGSAARVSTSRLNETFASLARQAVGTHPAVGQLANVVGTFALGGAATAGVLAGIAAIGVAWQRMGASAKEAREENERLLGILDDIADRRRIEALGPGGETVSAVAFARAEMARIEAEIAELSRPRARQEGAGPGAEIAALRTEYERLYALVRSGEADLLDARLKAADADQQARRAVLDEIAAMRARHAEERVRLEGIQAWSTAVEHSTANLEALNDMYDQLAARSASLRLDMAMASSAEEAGKFAEQLRGVVRQLERVNEERARMILTPGVGITDRPVGARGDGIPQYRGGMSTADLYTPGFIIPDMEPLAENADAMDKLAAGARVAAPLLGDFGRSLSGIASGIAAGGAIGIGTAIVSGIGGIVDGLMKSGADALRAAAAWDDALSDFGRAFDSISSWEQGLEDARRQFQALAEQGASNAGWDSFFPDIEGARQFVATYRDSSIPRIRELAQVLDEALAAYDAHVEGLRRTLQAQESQLEEDLRVRSLRAQGLDDQADAMALAIQQERELAEAREIGYSDATIELMEQVHAQERLALATREANDALMAVTSALNSPQGLNLALMTYRASLAGQRAPRDGIVSPGTGTIDSDRYARTTIQNLTVNVNGTTDARTTAREVMREIDRVSRLGGVSPLETVTR